MWFVHSATNRVKEILAWSRLSLRALFQPNFGRAPALQPVRVTDDPRHRARRSMRR